MEKIKNEILPQGSCLAEAKGTDLFIDDGYKIMGRLIEG